MIYDCFFSYQHEDIKIVESIVAELEKRGLSCWYAPRNVSGRYAKAITDGISHSKVFVLILNDRSIVSEAVLNEVEMAHNVFKKSKYAVIQPVCMQEIDFDEPDYQEMMYYIRRLHFLNADMAAGYEKIAEDIIRSQPQLMKLSKKRTESGYIVQDIEDVRLKRQNELMSFFDKDVYSSVFGKYDNPSVLDVGCGTGDMIFSKFDTDSISVFIGLDKSNRQIEAAKRKYDSEKCFFFEKDIEAESFDRDLMLCAAEAGVSKFDIINLSMILLHLKNPAKLLSILKNYLSDNGTVIIRDLDDGLNFAYPDPDNSFDRIYKMCDHDEQSGNRRNGRQIYNDLFRAGFTRIKLEKQGLSSLGMNDEQKESFFRMYFPFTLENAKIMSEKNPWNKEYEEDYLWYKDRYDSVHDLFLKPDFIFSLGFMSYTASL